MGYLVTISNDSLLSSLVYLASGSSIAVSFLITGGCLWCPVIAAPWLDAHCKQLFRKDEAKLAVVRCLRVCHGEDQLGELEKAICLGFSGTGTAELFWSHGKFHILDYPKLSMLAFVLHFANELESIHIEEEYEDVNK